jgi:hypothetical protein
MQVNPGIIVLDGTDCSGKTTLANAMIDRYGGRYLHATYRFKNQMHLYHLGLLRLAIKYHETTGKMVVIDRWWPSEMVYGDVYRGGRRVPNAGFRILHRLGLRYGITYVICYRDSREKLMEEYAKTHATGKELYDVDERMAKVHDGYKQLYEAIIGQQSRWHRYNVDSAIKNPEYFTFMMETIAKCSNWYTHQKTIADEELPHSVGSPFGDFVFVGERINPKNRALSYPWIAFQGVSYNMAVSLGELGVPEHRLLWTNAYLPSGEPNEQLGVYVKQSAPFKRVIAMGSKATKFCQDSGRCDFSMPHPAYITRFNGIDSLTRTLGVIFK